ncbi:MAG: type IV pilus assembly protein PilX [Cellvibrionaceae bacterium]|jgi:type IV pilus assembly protein PilX
MSDLRKTANHCPNQYQRGIVLVVALILLLVMTTVGVTAISSATLQERLANNSRQLATARINAESALRQAEAYMDVLGINTADELEARFIQAQNKEHQVSSRLTGIYADSSNYLSTYADKQSWNGDNSLEIETARYVIEYIGVFGKDGEAKSLNDDEPENVVSYVFQITAIGFAPPGEEIFAVLQSIYMTQK